MPAQTHVALFGVPRVSRGGQALVISVRKTLALVCYVAVEGRSSRARLAELFWGDLDEATARRNLRRALHRLRTAGLGEELQTDDESVAFADVRCDLVEFDAAVRAERWADAQALRTGPLCDGLELEDASGFDAWLRAQRERSTRDWRHATAQHAAALEAAGALRAAIDAHQRLLADDDLQEATYRTLMRLHDALGERAAALEIYARCERTLGEELGLQPLPDTRLLADRIRRRVATPTAPVDGTPSGATVAEALQSVPLVARDRELALLAHDGAPVLLIEGEAGVGKSRLALEACRRAHGGGDGTDGSAPLVVRFTELAMATPFHALADTLRAAAVAGGLAGLGPVWQHELARLLPEWSPAGAGAPAAAASPTEARTRLLEAVLQALARAAGTAQRILFDDLHWADASSLELLAHVARRRAQAPQTVPGVIATARGIELAANAAAQVALAAIEKDAALSRLPLAAFDDWSMLQLVQRLSRSGGGVRFATRLGGATGGNVFFALETIRALFESGELSADPVEGWSTRYDDTTTDYAELPLPASVVDAVRSRVARLGAAALRVLETAALAGDGCTLAEIQGATALTDWEALEGVERAVAAQVVGRDGVGYRFVHELFRSAIRSGLSPERLRLMHAKLAAALEPLQAAPARVAAHWQAAGDAAAAARAWTAAGEAAVKLHSHREASVHLARAAALTTDPEQAFALHERALDPLMVAALSDERRTMMQALLERAERSGSPRMRLRALARAAQTASLDRRYEESERLASQAVAQFPAGHEHAAAEVVFHIHALSCGAFAAGILGRTTDALAGYRAALDVAHRHGNGRAEAMMAGSAAMFAVQLDRLDEARALRDRALAAACAATPGTIHHAQALSRSSYVARADGQRALGIAQLGEAAVIARRTRSSTFLSNYLATLTEALVDDGQHAGARSTQLLCVEALAEDDVALARYFGPFTAAAVHEAHGELGAAVDAARAAVAAADALDDAPDRREARLLLAGLLAQVGNEAEALRLADAADAVEPRPPGCRLLPAENLRAAAEMRRDPRAARARLEQALAAPYADRLPQPHLAAANLLLGRCALADGQPGAARAAVHGLNYSVTVEAEATAIALEAAVRTGSVEPAELAAAIALIDSGRLAPLAELTLMRAVEAAADPSAASRWQARRQATAQALANSLAGSPPLQSAFIRRHRDLLT